MATPRIDNIESQDNVIINGNFDFWQEQTSFAAIADSTYVADLFRYGKTGTMVHTLARSTDVPDAKSTYSLGTTVTTAQASVTGSNFSAIRYVVEGYDLQPLAGDIMTLSFMVKATKTGIYSVGIRNAGATRAIALEYTVTASNTWQKITLTFTHDSSGTWNYTTGVGLELFFIQALGTSIAISPGTWQNSGAIGSVNQVNNCDTNGNIFNITQIMLRKGSSAGTYRRAGKNIVDELVKIQRYFEKSYNLGVFPGTADNSGNWALFSSGSIGNASMEFKVTKRTTPTIVLYNVGTGASGNWDKTDGTSNAVTVSAQGESRFTVVLTSFGANAAIRGHWVASARL